MEIYQSLYVNFQKRVEGERTNLISVTKDVGEYESFVHSKLMKFRLYFGGILVVQVCNTVAVFISLMVQMFYGCFVITLCPRQPWALDVHQHYQPGNV